MSPPLPVTEDTPPDMLAGAMDLHVVLPNGQDMKMSVERSTPMMDLLVQVTTANKMSPGGHVIQVIGDRGILPYKPSTPIGALDTWTIHIVPKKKAGMILKKPFTKPIPNTPFEQTFRLQVNLPRNQLYVSRVSYRTRLEDVLNEVCKEKNLDQSKYCFTHPDNTDEELDLKKTFLDHKVQQLTLVSKNNRPVGLSSSDVIALKRYDSRNQHVNNKYYASHSYDGSVSSGSMEGRSLSPVRSDESSSSPTIPKTNSILNRPFRKRRPAPKPPATQNGQETKNVSESLTISHSRNSSDSSGYHESSVLSESPESNSNSLADSLPRRSKLPAKTPSNVKAQGSHMNGKIGASLSRSLSNLVAVGDSKSRTFLSNGMRHKEYSASSMSLASIPGKKKKAPAPPPPMSKSLLSLQEESSSTTGTTLNGDFASNGRSFASIPEDVVSKSQTLPATSNKLSSFSTEPSTSNPASSYACSNKTTTSTRRTTPTTPEPKPFAAAAVRPVDNCNVAAVDEVDSGKITSLNSSSSASTTTTTIVNGDANGILKPESVKNTQFDVKDKELTMDDEEIDRIFHDATKDYESPSLPVLPSPPKLTNGFDEEKCQVNGEDPFNWEYKLPSPPKAFRDQSSSPSVTEYDTVTIGNLTEVITEKRLVPEEKASAPPNKYKIIPQLQLDPMSGDAQTKMNIEPTLSTASATSSTAATVTSAKKTYFEESNGQSPIDDHRRKMENASGMVTEQRCNCDKTPYIDVNYVSTNDSGLGSDESIPSVSEGRSCIEEPTSSMSSCISSTSSLSYAKKQPQPQQQIQQTATTAVASSTETNAPPERRGSTLQNFTITTYQNSKPTEIFHDDSVKTSKTTQLAKNNHPYVKLPFEKKSDSKGSALSRHSSFSTEKSPNNPVKRSKSHISLLSGNFAKFNRFGKLNIKEIDSSEQNSPVYSSSESIQTAEDVKPKVQPTVARLRKTLSEISINKDCNRGDEELLELQDQVMKWKQNDERMSRLKAKNVPELQSVQVLKDILPQINKPQLPPEVQSITSKTALEENYPSRARAFKVDVVRARNGYQDSSTTPAVNLQSWNERPKRQVSIKTDRDYVFGNIRRHTEMFSSNQNCSDNGVDEQSKFNHDSISKAAGSDNNADLSRVPIVRAVEFKKPFAQQLEKTYSANDLVKNVDKDKPRPASCYLFGEHLTNGVNRSQSMMVNNNNTSKSTHLNGTESIATKVNGIVNGRSDYDDNTSTTTTETTTSTYTNNVSKTKIMFNCSAPYNNKYKSVTEITEDTTIKRHSYPVFTAVPVTNPSETSSKPSEQYTFRNYKNKLLENEKLNGNDSKSTPTEKSSVPKQSPEKKSFFRIFRKEQSPQPAEVITTRSVGIPPPPPVMPTLKPVSQSRMSCQKSRSENSRDMLLSSIKNFNRDNLRNVRVK